MGEDGGSREAANANKGVLGDITNIYGKRRLSLVSEKDVAGQKIGRKGEEFRDSSFEGQLSGKARASVKCKDKIEGTPESLVDSRREDIFSFGSKQACQPVSFDSKGISVQRNVLSDLFSLRMRHDAMAHGVTDVDSLGQGYISFGSVPFQCDKSSESDLEEDCLEDHETDSADSMRYSFETRNDDGKSTASKCTGLDSVALNESKVDSGEGPSNVPLDKSGILESLKPSGSLDIKVDDGENAPNRVPSCSEINMSEKSCKCSFCLKAAYIWTDLYYQDTRGRLSALKKSKRLARSLEVRSCGNNYNIKATKHSSKRSAELEFELTQQWRSLFLSTENVLVREISQLHANFLRLKELRENCKRDLQNISMVPSDK